MKAADQLAMFEPDAWDAVRLLETYIKSARLQCAAAERFELLGMQAAASRMDRAAVDSADSALVLATYLDLLEVCE